MNCRSGSLKHLEKLEYAVNIEDLTKQKSLLRYTLLDVEINEFAGGKKSFEVMKAQLPPNLKEKKLCLVPMEKFNNEINDEGDCIFAKIDKFSSGSVHFTKRPFFDRGKKCMRFINNTLRYAVRFISNRTTHDASINAIKKIIECDLESYFENFEVEPYHKKSTHRFFTQEEFKWFNPKIAANKEQIIAISNIVNGASFPFPYIIFGPPGNISKIIKNLITIFFFIYN